MGQLEDLLFKANRFTTRLDSHTTTRTEIKRQGSALGTLRWLAGSQVPRWRTGCAPNRIMYSRPRLCRPFPMCAINGKTTSRAVE